MTTSSVWESTSGTAVVPTDFPTQLAAPSGSSLVGTVGAAASGVVARTVESKLRDFATVQDFGTVVVYDNFDRPDRLLQGDIAPSGQTWLLSGAGAATAAIVDGKYTATGNTYASLNYGSTIPKIGGSFSFVSGTGTNDRSLSGMCTLICDNAQIALQNLLHLIIGPDGWTLQKFVAGVTTGILSAQHSLRTDGSVYQISYSIVGNTVTVNAPNGQVYSVTDADVGALPHSYGIWQITQLANSFIGRWHSCNIGKRPADDARAMGVGAPMGDISYLLGARFSPMDRKGLRDVSLSGGIGWYTIANAATNGGYSQAGRVFLHATDTATFNVGIELKIQASSSDTVPIITQEQVFGAVGTPIDQIRLSTSNGVGIHLDIHLSRANVCTLDVDFMGAFIPVELPVVGAVALGTGSTVITVDLTLGRKSYPELRVAPTYGANVAINGALGNIFDITVTNGTALQVDFPTNMSLGQKFTITIINTFGVMGLITWQLYKMSSWTNPVNGTNRSITFEDCGGNVWRQISQTGVDVPN